MPKLHKIPLVSYRLNLIFTRCDYLMLTSAPGDYTEPTNRQAKPEESFLVPEITLLIQ